MDGQEFRRQRCQQGRKFENSVVIMWNRTMSWFSICAQTEAHGAFFCRLHRVIATALNLKPTSSTLIERVLSLNQFRAMLDNPARARVSTTFLIRGGHIN